MTEVNSCAVILWNRLSRRFPALLTTASMRPKASIAAFTIASAPPRLATLSPLAIARPPAATISLTTFPATEPSLASPLKLTPRSLTTTAAPAVARSSATPRPTPRPAPVTSATFPSITPMIYLNKTCPQQDLPSTRLASIAPGEIKHLLADEAQNELLGDRRESSQRSLAIEPLDVIFLGVAESAMGHHRLPGGFVAGAGAEELGAVAFGAASASAGIQLSRL